MPLYKIDFKNYQELAEKIAKEAGQILFDFQKKIKIEKYKEDSFDIVTNADLASEEFIIKEIRRLYPDHNLVSEEKGGEVKKTNFTWFIDPLDGTKEYVRGLPEYNVCISLVKNNEIIIGVVFQPVFNELYGCAKGCGASFNKKPITVSKEEDLKNSFIFTRIPSSKAEKPLSDTIWSSLRTLADNCYRLRAQPQEVISLCWVARGVVEGAVLFPQGLEWYDTAPGLLMVKEAGGVVTNLMGNPINLVNFQGPIIASNGKIHEKLLSVLSPLWS